MRCGEAVRSCLCYEFRGAEPKAIAQGWDRKITDRLFAKSDPCDPIEDLFPFILGKLPNHQQEPSRF